MQNLQKELENLISSLKYKPKLMLHCCCAPCSSYVVEYLKEHFEIYMLYYNPNISPYEEYEIRLLETKRLAKYFGVEFISLDWENEVFEQASVNLENVPEGSSRCNKCFELRLRKTAELANLKDCEYFTTTLSISPLKNSAKLFEIGERISKEYSVPYLPSDFKKKNGYKRSTELSKELGLYRQNYCGCRFSKRDSLLRGSN